MKKKRKIYFNSLFTELVQTNLKQNPEFLPKIYCECLKKYTNAERKERNDKFYLDANWQVSFSEKTLG